MLSIWIAGVRTTTCIIDEDLASHNPLQHFYSIMKEDFIKTGQGVVHKGAGAVST